MTEINPKQDEISLEPYWYNTHSRPFSRNQSIAPDLDLLIVGAGYTGLSAACVAHDLGAKTAVVDAREAGNGASTRNGGMFGAHPKLSWDELSKKFNSETADKIFSEASEALYFVKDLIKREEISCDLKQTGRIQLAWTEKDFESQKQLVLAIKSKSNVDVAILKRHELKHEINTNRYYGAILFKEHCAIDPAKFHSGLTSSVLSRNIPIIENSPVISIIKEPGGHRVLFSEQDIFVKKVIVATNGYTANDFSWFKRRVVPIPSYIIATEDLPSDLIQRLAPGGRMMVETRAKNSYFRISPNGKKIIFGGRAAMKPIPLEIAAKRLKSSLEDIWPELNGCKLTHAWTGNTGYSFNHAPHVGTHKGIFYAMGFSGSGTVLAPYLGAKVAYHALEDSRGKTAYSKTVLKTSPLHFLKKPYFLSLVDFWFRNFIDSYQNRLKRK